MSSPTGNNEATDDRAHAVRADNEVSLNGSPVSKAKAAGPPRSLRSSVSLVIEMQPHLPRPTQDVLGGRDWRGSRTGAPNLLIIHVLTNGVRCDAAAVAPVAVDELAGLSMRRLQEHRRCPAGVVPGWGVG